MTESFRIDIADHDLDDLRQRIRRTRWADPPTVNGWEQGVPLDVARELCDFWIADYDWRRCELELNSLPQALVTVDGGGTDPLDIHVVHIRSKHPGAMPLLITHGWPGSIIEYLDLIDALVDPPDPMDAFDVILPSLPGHGFSGKPTQPGWNVERIAHAWNQLMTELGYTRYGAHGGDWGSIVTAAMGSSVPDRLVGIHLTLPLAAEPPASEQLPLTDEEAEGLADSRRFRRESLGYSLVQSSRPQTLAYGLADSPVGQLAWIVDKFWEWTDHNGRLETVVSKDRVLDNVMLYWLTNSAGSAARLYWESARNPTMDAVPIPAGVSVFRKELARLPRSWVARRFDDIRLWSTYSTGGHFAALEQPELLVGDLRRFFKGLR